MATSNSSDFTVSRDEIIKGALRIIRAYTRGESGPETEQITDASEALNMLVKNLSVASNILWTHTDATLPLVASQSSYTIGPVGTDLTTPRPTKLLPDTLLAVKGTTEIPVTLISRTDYKMLVNKSSEGDYPTQVYYDRQLTDGVIYVWPTPNSGDYSLKFSYERVIEDFDASGNTPDFTPEWFRVLKWLLAAEIAPEYGIKTDKLMFLESKADRLLQDALNHEVEPFVQFTPAYEDYEL